MRESRRDKRSDRDIKMHKAVCAECGQKCEVPFLPSNDKPIYCNDCFSRRKNSDSRGSQRRDFGRRDFGRNRDRQMFSAICDKCGDKCELPFRPTEGKPVFCDKCFGKSDKRGDRNNQGSNQLQEVNNKLDKIINALIAAKIIKPEKEKKEVKKETVAKKTAKPKKVATKEPAAKKKTAAKKKATTKKKK